MTRWPVTHERGPDGRARARALDTGACVLADWLTTDMPWPDMADHLANAPEGEVATGNAYAVTIGLAEARIQSLHDPTRADTRIPLGIFRCRLRAWAAFLQGGA